MEKRALNLKYLVIITAVLFTSCFLAFAVGTLSLYTVRSNDNSQSASVILSGIQSDYSEKMSKGTTLDKWLENLKKNN